MTTKLKILSLIMTMLVTACAPAAIPVFDTSDLAAQARAEAQVAIDATQTAVSVTIEAQAAEPSRLDFVLGADAANGETLFNTFQADAGFACGTCHWVDTENMLIGPGLLNISTRAESRVNGQDAADYVFESIVNPDAYIVDSFNADLMPENWRDIYSEEQIYDIMAYLWTLNG